MDFGTNKAMIQIEHCVDFTAQSEGCVFDVTKSKDVVYLLRRLWSHIGRFEYIWGGTLRTYSIANCFTQIPGKRVDAVPSGAVLVARDNMYSFYESALGGYVATPWAVTFHKRLRDNRRVVLPMDAYIDDYGCSVRRSLCPDTVLARESYKNVGEEVHLVGPVSSDCKKLYKNVTSVYLGLVTGKEYVRDRQGYYTQIVAPRREIARVLFTEAVNEV